MPAPPLLCSAGVKTGAHERLFLRFNRPCSSYHVYSCKFAHSQPKFKFGCVVGADQSVTLQRQRASRQQLPHRVAARWMTSKAGPAELRVGRGLAGILPREELLAKAASFVTRILSVLGLVKPSWDRGTAFLDASDALSSGAPAPPPRPREADAMAEQSNTH